MPSSLDYRERSTFGLTASDRSVAAMVLVIKAAVLIYGALSFQIINDERVRTLTQLLSIWNRWDGPQYLLIAQHGYAASGDQRLALAFFPLYPWLIRLLTIVVRDAVLSAFLISTAASVVAGVALARLFAIDYVPPHLARRAAWFLFIFPTSYFLHIDYSESLFLALVLTCFVAARRERWFQAGLLGAFAALARPNGILLLPALGADTLWELWETHRFNWRWLWLGLVLMGFAVYLWINYRITGDPLVFLNVQRAALVAHFGDAMERHPGQFRRCPRLETLPGRNDRNPGAVLPRGRPGRHDRRGRFAASVVRGMDGARLAAVREPIVGHQRASLHADDVPDVSFDRDAGSQASLEYGDYRMVAAVAGAVHERVRPRPLDVLSEPCGWVKSRSVASARRRGYF